MREKGIVPELQKVISDGIIVRWLIPTKSFNGCGVRELMKQNSLTIFQNRSSRK
jgi:hypothetical protein